MKLEKICKTIIATASRNKGGLRGRVIKWYDNEFCLVELFCNGKRYKVNKQTVHITSKM